MIKHCIVICLNIIVIRKYLFMYYPVLLTSISQNISEVKKCIIFEQQQSEQNQ